jgi:hypothetical protein
VLCGRAVVRGEGVERAGAPQRGSRAPARECAVQVDGQVEVAAEPVPEQQRLRARRPALGLRAVHDRGDVERPHARVHARVGGEVDPVQRDPRPLDERLMQLARRAREREHGAVVVGVGVDVEDAGAVVAEGGGDRVEHGVVAALGDVGDGQQQRVSPPRRSRRSATASPGPRRARASSAR